MPRIQGSQKCLKKIPQVFHGCSSCPMKAIEKFRKVPNRDQPPDQIIKPTP
jgi:fructose/tagatose bisphosphate aldolase